MCTDIEPFCMRKGSYDANLTHSDANVLNDFYPKKILLHGHSTELHQCFSTQQLYKKYLPQRKKVTKERRDIVL